MGDYAEVYVNGNLHFTKLEGRNQIVEAINRLLEHGRRIGDIEVIMFTNNNTEILDGKVFVPRKRGQKR